ncbi:MAG: methyltransferase domain-containing protein [Acidobacteria bacterium]|nr:methyltransferase domain-containing protein [Acidobacteriota bacterium]
MSLSPTLPVDRYRARREAFQAKLLESLGGAFRLLGVYLGDQLGYYEALAAAGALTSAGLADATQTHERYAREWLEQQTTAGVLEVDDENRPAAERRYSLPEAHRAVLADPDSLDFMAPLGQLLAGASKPLPRLLEAYRTGAGIPFEAYGEELRTGQSRINRAMFLQQLGQEWIPTMPDVLARLASAPGARVADIGCGCGWSAIGVAQCFPQVQVDGFDFDAPSVADARRNVAAHGLEDRVRTLQADAGDPSFEGRYDLVMALECVHDMGDPVGALRTMRRLAGPDGAVLIADECVAEKFRADGGDVDWMMYGWSMLHCLPVGLVDPPAKGTGTCMRPDTLREYALEAGFDSVEILPIESLFFRFYRLRA